MKRNSLKTKKYLKNKKGFSLLELLCAVMIMAIAVSATATGLAISYQSITRNSLLNQSSAKAQMYCDVIMTYVEKTPSIDPAFPQTTLSDDDKAKNKLFAASSDYIFKDEIKDNIKVDVAKLDSSMTEANQYSKTDIGSRAFNKSEVAYVVESAGTYTTSANVDMKSYRITVYIDYGTNGTATCTGVVTKPMCAI